MRHLPTLALFALLTGCATPWTVRVENTTSQLVPGVECRLEFGTEGGCAGAGELAPSQSLEVKSIAMHGAPDVALTVRWSADGEVQSYSFPAAALASNPVVVELRSEHVVELAPAHR